MRALRGIWGGDLDLDPQTFSILASLRKESVGMLIVFYKGYSWGFIKGMGLGCFCFLRFVKFLYVVFALGL